MVKPRFHQKSSSCSWIHNELSQATYRYLIAKGPHNYSAHGVSQLFRIDSCMHSVIDYCGFKIFQAIRFWFWHWFPKYRIPLPVRGFTKEREGQKFRDNLLKCNCTQAGPQPHAKRNGKSLDGCERCRWGGVERVPEDLPPNTRRITVGDLASWRSMSRTPRGRLEEGDAYWWIGRGSPTSLSLRRSSVYCSSCKSFLFHSLPNLNSRLSEINRIWLVWSLDVILYWDKHELNYIFRWISWLFFYFIRYL